MHNNIIKTTSDDKYLKPYNFNETTKDTTIAPALIHEEGNLIIRAIRDIYSKEMKNILVEGTEAFKETKKYVSQLLPSCSKYVKEYKNKIPIFVKVLSTFSNFLLLTLLKKAMKKKP